MSPHRIQTETEHQAALARVGVIFAAHPGSPEFDELVVLVRMVDEYESKAHPIDPPRP